jgi:protein phosphatase methylesterase 1
MSDFARSFARSRLASLPAEPPLPEPPLEEDDEEDADTFDTVTTAPGGTGDDSSSASSVSSAGTIRPPPPRAGRRGGVAPDPDAWRRFFQLELFLTPDAPDAPKAAEGLGGDAGDGAQGRGTEGGHFHVYLTPPSTPSDALLVFHHGCGATALSFALLVEALSRPGALPAGTGLLAFDARGHGLSTVGAAKEDWSMRALVQDTVSVVKLAAARLAWKGGMPRVMLVGHSLGGAVVANVAASGLLAPHLIGLCVIDVVEGAVADALRFSLAYAASRPPMFRSLGDAVDWHVKSRTLRSAESARVSVPAMFVKDAAGAWRWRVDLAETQEYWEDWFTGLSGKFLGAKCAKLLILAGSDSLDKELTIGQMQGEEIRPGPSGYLRKQASSRITSCPRRDTMSTRTRRSGRRISSPSSSSGTIRTCSRCRPRCRSCSQEGKRCNLS